MVIKGNILPKGEGAATSMKDMKSFWKYMSWEAMKFDRIKHNIDN